MSWSNSSGYPARRPRWQGRQPPKAGPRPRQLTRSQQKQLASPRNKPTWKGSSPWQTNDGLPSPRLSRRASAHGRRPIGNGARVKRPSRTAGVPACSRPTARSVRSGTRETGWKPCCIRLPGAGHARTRDASWQSAAYATPSTTCSAMRPPRARCGASTRGAACRRSTSTAPSSSAFQLAASKRPSTERRESAQGCRQALIHDRP